MPMNFTMRSRISAFVYCVLLLTTIPPVLAKPASARPDAARIASACEGCHGDRGRGSGEIPGISGLSESLFVQKMNDFRSDRSPSTVMNRIAKGYQDADFVNLARFFAGRGGQR